MALTSEILHRYLIGQLGVDPHGLADDTLLFSEGRVDSFALVDLMLFVEREAGIRVGPDDVTLAHFDSVERILRFARARAQAPGGG